MIWKRVDKSQLSFLQLLSYKLKLKSKVQGAFRSDFGSEIYCRVRGYIATMKKNGQNQCETLKSIFELYDITLPIINQKGEPA